ncbi:SDR family NAD(P)-dependent oxidoreductase [Anaerovibrio sp. JC8]|uniref:SDR family NAD(P)-dependent oxidoreductase n=1 Tax=Anaerovibrio sp. JC8 TaxID=1240085 RepID=UPI000A103DBF|nr:SDR family oxidoreductase [Anaerovibrio sp. JC8]
METKTVIITGGTSGIGLAAAKRFAGKGYNVVMLGRDTDRGLRAVKSVMEKVSNARCNYIPCDVRKLSDCADAVQKTLDIYKRIDILVNSAGIYFERAIEDMDEEDFDLIMDVNVKGTYFMTRQVAMEMKKQGSGAIVNVSSDAGVHGNMLCSAYCASKGAVNLFTKAMALELAPWNIRVNSVCPGDVMTPLTEKQLQQYPDRDEALREMSSVYPLGKIGTPEEVAAVIDFLASDEAAFVNGAIWSVDGGITA